MSLLVVPITRESSFWILLVVGTAILWVVWRRRWWRWRKSNAKSTAEAVINGERLTCLRLRPTEDSMLMSGPMLVSTLTWFDGNHQTAAACLQERLTKLVVANPWLTGRIVRRAFANYIAYPSLDNVNGDDDQDDNAIKNASIRRIFRHIPPDESPWDRHTPIPTIAALARRNEWVVSPGWTNQLYKVTVIPCRSNPTQKFALLVSLSHVAGDGHSFYTLYNYLVGGSNGDDDNSDGHIACPTLMATRVFEDARSVSDINVHVNRHLLRQPLLVHSLAFLLPSVAALIVGKVRKAAAAAAAACWGNTSKSSANNKTTNDPYQARLRYFFMGASALNRLKQAAVKDNHDKNDTSTPIDFVSSNDVIASWFFSNYTCRHGFMIVNWRSRVPGYTNAHAGNYFTFLHYNIPVDCATPRLIRRSIMGTTTGTTASTMAAANTAPTSTRPWLFIGGNVVLTNWSTFASSKVTLPGGGTSSSPCREELHCPLVTHQGDIHPANLVVGTVFRARGENQLGMFVIGTDAKLQGLATPCPFEAPDAFG